MRSRFAVPALASLLLACSTETASSFKKSDGGTTNDAGFEEVVDSGLEIPQGDGGTIASNTPIGTLKGTTYAPDGTLELPGAVIYLSATLPTDEPRGAVCDTCVDLTGKVSSATSKIDGTFELNVFAPGKQYLVVEKGRFRRVREITLKAGANVAPAESTTIAGANNPSVGDYAPKILVIPTSMSAYDNVHQTLSSLNFDFDELTDAAALTALKSPTKLKDYAFIFLPCGTNDEGSCSSGNAFDPTVKSRLKDYVKSGGRLYVTDYAYEYVRQNWPNHIKWYNKDNSGTSSSSPTADQGLACNFNATTRSGTWEDPGLKQWMGVVGNRTAGEDLEGIFTTINSVSTVTGEDPSGASVQITPKIWVKADGKPATVTFPDKCGRVLFSTNHTEGGAGGGGLLAQEKAIVYTLLEVSTCINGNIDK